MRILPATLICVLYTFYASGQQPDPSAPNYSNAQVKEDLFTLMNAMKEAQTGLYRYTSAARINKTFKRSLRSLLDSVSYQDIFRHATALISVTGCSHSGTSHTQEHQEALKNSSVFFPYKLIIANGKYYIRKHVYTDTLIKDGSRLIAVNGVKMPRISKILSKYIDRESNITTHLFRAMEQDFAGLYADFIDRPRTFTLKIIPPLSKRTIQLQVAPKNKKQLHSADPRPPLGFIYIDSLSTGIYRISLFNKHYITSREQDFISFTDEVFDQLNKNAAKNLVLDLRGNQGGLTAYTKYLLSYFIDKPQIYIESIETKNTGKYSFSHLLTAPVPYTDSMRFEATQTQLFKWINNPNLEAKPHPTNRFTGNIYILADGNSMSASAIFCAAMQLHTNAKFIGEETGGAAGGLNGLPIYLQLPNSKIDIKLSTAKYMFRTKSKKERGIMPDISIQKDINDFCKGMDTVLEKALHQIKSAQKINP